MSINYGKNVFLFEIISLLISIQFTKLLVVSTQIWPVEYLNMFKWLFLFNYKWPKLILFKFLFYTFGPFPLFISWFTLFFSWGLIITALFDLSYTAGLLLHDVTADPAKVFKLLVKKNLSLSERLLWYVSVRLYISEAVKLRVKYSRPLNQTRLPFEGFFTKRSLFP